jgi:hypothetical protein
LTYTYREREREREREQKKEQEREREIEREREKRETDREGKREMPAPLGSNRQANGRAEEMRLINHIFFTGSEIFYTGTNKSRFRNTFLALLLVAIYILNRFQILRTFLSGFGGKSKFVQNLS